MSQKNKALPEKPRIEMGEEAWAIVSRKSGKERRTLEGAALVRVVGMQFPVSPTSATRDVYRVEVLRSSGGSIVVGHSIEMDRRDLYRAKDLDESRAFVAEVRRLWQPPE